MSFGDLLDFIKRLRLMLINEGPRDNQGVLLQPFLGWVARLEKDIALSNRVVLLDKETKEGGIEGG